MRRRGPRAGGPTRPRARRVSRHTPARQNGPMQLPRFWIAMQVLIIVCVLISAVIVIVKL
jgi:hypothetical protein